MEVTEEQFLQDVANHQMHIEMDNGVHRSILFKGEGTGIYHFRLTTWPNHLCISGDAGTYVFQRTKDMFCFFRTDKNDFNYNKSGLSINPTYWSEKIQAKDRHGHVQEFDAKGTAKHLSESYYNFEADEDAAEMLGELRHASTDEEALHIMYQCDVDCAWEYLCHNYTSNFLWCLYAIAWGIEQYDKNKEDA